MRKIDLAYWAGLFDGEGCIYLTPATVGGGKKKYIRLMVVITNSNEWLIRACHFSFGGSIVEQKPRAPQHSVSFRWVTANKKAFNFLVAVRPYLKIKAPQADIAIAFQKAIFSRGHSKLTEEEALVREAQRVLLQSMHSKQGPPDVKGGVKS